MSLTGSDSGSIDVAKSNIDKSELFKERTVKETFLCITPFHMETFSVVALCLLGTLPLVCAFVDHFLKSGLMVLYRTNSSIGYLGLLFGVFYLIWRHFQPDSKSLRERMRGQGLAIFLSLMLFWSVLSCIFSTNPLQSFMGDWYRLDGLMSYFAYAGIFIFASQIRNRANWRIILTFFSTTASILALLCLLNILQVNFFLNIQQDKAIFFNTNHYGYYICMALPAAVGLLVTYDYGTGEHRNWIGLILYSLEIALLTNALIMSKSFGPLLAVVGSFFGMLILCIFVDRARVRRVLFALAIFVLISIISSANSWNIVKDIQRTSNEIEMVTDHRAETPDEEINHIGSGRGKLWINAVRFVTERPLFGYGPDNLGEVYTEAGCKNDRPHCEPLQFAASLGIPAAVFYLAGLTCLLIEFIIKFRNLNIAVLCSFCVVGSYLLSSAVGNTMFYTSPFFFMMLGMANGLIKTVNISDKSR